MMTGASGDTDLETTSSPVASADISAPESLHYIVTHIFHPPRQFLDWKAVDCHVPAEMDLSLFRAVCVAAHAYSAHICGTSEPRWPCITKMLDNLQASIQTRWLDNNPARVISQLQEMQTGGASTVLCRPVLDR